jgi:hypothetical protein
MGTATRLVLLLPVCVAFETQLVTEATTSTTGSIITAGGLGVQKKANIGGTLAVGGAVNLADTTASTSSTTGSLVLSGGLGIAKKVYHGSGYRQDHNNVARVEMYGAGGTGEWVPNVLSCPGHYICSLN